MTMGYGCTWQLELEDETCLIYSYGPFNWNYDEFRNSEYERDGLIVIDKDCFIEPIIREKIKRQPGKRKKKIIKKVLVEVDYMQYIAEGRVKIENSKYAWRKDPNLSLDIDALFTLWNIFDEYQIQGQYPEGSWRLS